MGCAACGKWLRANEVMRALHAPRSAGAPQAPPMRARETNPHARPAPADNGLRSAGARAAPSRRDRTSWPPTRATRAAAAAAAKPS